MSKTFHTKLKPSRRGTPNKRENSDSFQRIEEKKCYNQGEANQQQYGSLNPLYKFIKRTMMTQSIVNLNVRIVKFWTVYIRIVGRNLKCPPRAWLS